LEPYDFPMHPLSDTTLKADEASFVLVRDAARDALRANPSLDGRAWWQPLKERLSDSPSTEWEWAPFDQEKAALRDSVLPLPDRRSDYTTDNLSYNIGENFIFRMSSRCR
jgi:hypothetical protein